MFQITFTRWFKKIPEQMSVPVYLVQNSLGIYTRGSTKTHKVLLDNTVPEFHYGFL